MNPKTFADLVGETIVRIDGSKGDDELVLLLMSGSVVRLYHWQDCCESVTIDDIIGDVDDLLRSPILVAEEVSNKCEGTPDGVDIPSSYTWTFYKLCTIKGSVTIRWLGESNGYYSERVEVEWTGLGAQA